LRSCPRSFFFYATAPPRPLPSFPTRRSSDLRAQPALSRSPQHVPRSHALSRDRRSYRGAAIGGPDCARRGVSLRSGSDRRTSVRSEEHTSELQSLTNLVCRLLLEKKNNAITH